MFNRSRRKLTIAALAAAVAAPLSIAAATSSANAAAYCGIQWGSLPKTTSASNMWTGSVNAVRAGRHACFDRVVFDIGRGSGKLGYNVRYVNAVAGPSGIPVPLTGGAKLQVTINAPAMSRVPASGVVNYAGWQTFRQLKWVASFEGYTDFGLGVRARLPMRTFVLDNADGSKRLVVDVAHRW